MSTSVFLMAQQVRTPVWTISTKMRELGLLGDVRYRNRRDGTDCVTVDFNGLQGLTVVPRFRDHAWAESVAQLAGFLARRARAVQLVVQVSDVPEVEEGCQVRACDLARMLPQTPGDASVVFFIKG